MLSDSHSDVDREESTFERVPQDLDRIEAAANDCHFLRLENDSTEQGRETESDRGFRASFEVAGYKLHERLGSGGTSVVYRATRVEDARQSYAIKALTLAALDRGAELRFRREVEVLQRLRHPHIAKLYDSGVAANEQPYLVLEYIDGRTISRYCEENHLGITERVKLFVEVCRALEYAHSRGILHRDIKPSNVLVNRNGKPTLTDFGLAKSVQTIESNSEETRTGTVLGTLNYLAPEQIFSLKREIDVRTDVFGLGALLYKLLSGKPPFEFENLVEAARDYFRRVPVRIETDREIPSQLEAICLKCLSARPADRYATVSSLRGDVERHLAGHAVSVRQSRILRRASLLHRHNPTLTVMLTGMLIVALICGVLFFSLWQSAQQGLQDSKRKTEQLKKNILGYADQVKAQEGDPSTLFHRRQQMRYIREQLLSLEDEFERDPELLHAHAQNDFKLGRVEHLLGAFDKRLQYLESADKSFNRLASVDAYREKALFGSFNVRLMLASYGSALEIIETLCDEHPDNIDYREARCTVIMFRVDELDLDKESALASDLLDLVDKEVDWLLSHDEADPRFHRKAIQSGRERSRLLVHQGKLDQAQERMWRVLDHYDNFDIFASAVVSESDECILAHHLALAIAAFRSDAEAIEQLYASASDVYAQAYDRYPNFPHLQERWTQLVLTCIFARRRMQFNIEMSELSNTFLESLERWRALRPNDLYVRFRSVHFHASSKIPGADLAEAHRQMDQLLVDQNLHYLTGSDIKTLLIRLGRTEEACRLDLLFGRRDIGVLAQSDQYLQHLLDQLANGVPFEELRFETVPRDIEYRLLANRQLFYEADLNRTLREMVQDGRAALKAKPQSSIQTSPEASKNEVN